jgi:hypothetical protein
VRVKGDGKDLTNKPAPKVSFRSRHFMPLLTARVSHRPRYRLYEDMELLLTSLVLLLLATVLADDAFTSTAALKRSRPFCRRPTGPYTASTPKGNAYNLCLPSEISRRPRCKDCISQHVGQKPGGYGSSRQIPRRHPRPRYEERGSCQG